MTTTVTAKIQVRNGSAAQWTSANPTLLSGEIGFETDTGKQKIGDGVTAWTALVYYNDPDLINDHGGLSGLSDDDHSLVYLRYTIGSVAPSSPRVGDFWMVIT